MKWLLARIGLPKAIGVYVDEDAVALSRIVATPLGPVEITCQSETFDEGHLAETIGQLVGPLLGKRKFRRTPVSVGIPSHRVYFSTRPVHAATGDSSAHVLLREALRSPNIAVGDMVVDVVRTEPDSRDVVSIASCDKAYLGQILDALKALDVYPSRTEPAPCALLRLAGARHRVRRSAKVVLRLFLSGTQVLAVLVVNNLPLLWRFTNLTQGEEASTLLMASRSLLATSKDCGVESPLDAVMIHGRAELKRLLDLDWLEEQLDTSIDWFDGPELNQSQIAYGVAQGGLDKEGGGFDLGRSLKPRPTLLQLFPWRDAVMQLALLVCMALLLGYTYWTLRESEQVLQTNVAVSPAEATTKKMKLQKEKKQLGMQVSAIREFLNTRVLWTSCLRDLSLCVPEEMYLTSVRGVCELRSLQKKKGSTKTKKSLALRGAVRLPASGTVPPEIDRLLVALRSDPTLEEEFPLVTLDELQHIPSKAGQEPMAIFSIVCLPGQKKGSAKKGSGAAKGGKKPK